MKTVNSDGSISTPDSESEDDEGEDVQELELTVGRHEPVCITINFMFFMSKFFEHTSSL